MDQVKIGRFIAQRRKAVGLTQMQLAEKLNITDRAISKWETARALPDSSIMLELCEILKISVNDLLSGEVVTMDQYDKNLEKNLMDALKQKEAADKQMLTLEIAIGVFSVLLLFLCIFAAAFIPMANWIRISLGALGFVLFLIGVSFALKIEQTAGYYQCAKCQHRYVPTFSSVYWAMHVNRTRYMKCPKCGQRTWQKKRLAKD